MRHLSRHKMLWTFTGLLALATAGLGVWRPSLYQGLVTDRVMPGVLAQDLVSVAAAVVVLSLVPVIRRDNTRSQLVVLGLLVYLFYAFGIYAIEQIYNEAYLAYLTIFGLSFYGVIYGTASLDLGRISDLSIPTTVRNVSVGYLMVNAVVFVGLWTSQLLPLMRSGEKIELTYSIYILDLCFIMPAFVIAGVMALRDRPLGLAAVPALLIAGFAVLFPLAVAEFLRPVVYGTAMEAGVATMFSALSGVFVLLAIVYLRAMQPG